MSFEELTQHQCDQYAKSGYSYVPKMRTVLADCDTPVSAYLKLANKPYSYLFESVQGGAQWGRYSIIGLPCCEYYRIKDKNIVHLKDGDIINEYSVDNAFDEIDAIHSSIKVLRDDTMPMMTGGLVGYFGYESVRYIESKLDLADLYDPIGADDIVLMLSLNVLVFDNLAGKIHCIVHVDPSLDDAANLAESRLQDIEHLLQRSMPQLPKSKATLTEDDFRHHTSKEDFFDAVEKCKQHVIDGDIFQVVIGQRMSAPYKAHPFQIYRALRTVNPSPYLFYVDVGDIQFAGSSPEILVRAEDEVVTVRPLAGTRKRGATPEKDKELEQELISDEKEIAEHLMLVDLGRNDVGRIAQTGSVRVTDSFSVERYSHVMHIVSNVEGQLKADLTPTQVLKATFPAGTLSGAPKVRAMEVIYDVEREKRGVYGGAVGYIGWDGNLDTAIAIRTAVIKDETVYVQAGAGVVFDSQPELEWLETNNKARAVVNSAILASTDLVENKHR